MRQIETIQLDHYYHIYNRGINGENLFYSDDNYRHFLKLYKKYIFPIAETFAWCLLKNHFHLLIKIRSEEEVCSVFSINSDKAKKKPSQQFSNLFNAYAQARQHLVERKKTHTFDVSNVKRLYDNFFWVERN